MGVVVHAGRGALHDIRVREQALRVQEGLVAARPVRQAGVARAGAAQAACWSPSGPVTPGQARISCHGSEVRVSVPAHDDVPAVTLALVPQPQVGRPLAWRCFDRSARTSPAVPGACRP